jgi:hypothetical protein
MFIPFGDPIAIGYAIYLLYMMEAIFPQYHYSFIIANESNKPIILETIAVDGFDYLEHTVKLEPQNRDPMQPDESSHTFNVFRTTVKTFEMVVRNEDRNINYSCELITKTGRIFYIGVGGRQLFSSPLEGISSPLDDRPIQSQQGIDQSTF